MAASFQNMTAAVTGATGFLGAHLTRRLLSEGARVRALVRHPEKAAALQAAGAEVVPFDLEREGDCAASLRGCDTVFHCAAVLNEYRPRSYYRLVNAEGTRRVASAAVEAGAARFVHVSTVWVYGLKGSSLDENAAYTTARHHYTDTKIEAERIVREMAARQGLPAVIVQPSELYGPGDRAWTLRPLQLLKSGKMVLVGGGRAVLQFLYIDDAVEGLLSAARRGRPGERYILCGRERLTLREYVERLMALGNFKTPPALPAWLGYAAACLLEGAANIAGKKPDFTRQEIKAILVEATYDGRKAREELEFEPSVTLDEGLRRVSAWIHEHPELMDV